MDLWTRYCDAHGVAEHGVPLFEADAEGVVAQRRVGATSRPVLVRSAAMEALVQRTVAEALASPASDGLLYLMHRLDAAGGVVPLYAGKAEKTGRSGRVSVNLSEVAGASRRTFARWGDGYAYHVGDLSAVACAGHAEARASDKYRAWAGALFAETGEVVRLRPAGVRFWATAWGPEKASVWREAGSVPLAFEEYLVIGVASLLFPGVLLNREGVRRGVEGASTGAVA